jgi:hypothetical protein
MATVSNMRYIGTPDPPRPWTGDYKEDSVPNYDADIVIAGTEKASWVPIQTANR